MQLTEAEIADIEMFSKSVLDNRGDVIASPEILDAQAILRLIADLRAVYAENQQLRDATRWRLPDPKTGEWKELPEPGDLITVTLEHSFDHSLWECNGEYHAAHEWVLNQPWHGQNKVVAWRPRPAPYTAADAGEPTA